VADEVVVGATRKDLVVVLIDATTGQPIVLTGGSAKLQGRSPDLVAVNIDAVMTLSNPAVGQVTMPSLGSLVTHANLAAASIQSAVYKLRVRFVDASAKVDFGPEFELVFKDNPLGA
jgi:hypothetical protein